MRDGWNPARAHSRTGLLGIATYFAFSLCLASCKTTNADVKAQLTPPHIILSLRIRGMVWTLDPDIYFVCYDTGLVIVR
jgi:hypothetical protein